MGFFEDLRELRDVTTRQVESLGGVYGDPFNEIATIVAVSDPKKLGRVKVQYQDDGVSDWIYVLNGSNKGLLSAQFIGSTCLIGKSLGNSEDAFVIGLFNKSTEAAVSGTPVQVPIISEQIDANRVPNSPGDEGLRCNEGNIGKEYIFDNEFRQVKRICLRTNSRQEGGEPTYAWWDETPALYVEKGTDPNTPAGTGTSVYQKTGIEECTKSLEGQIREFTEDRKFRRFQVKCARDENGEYTWEPLNSTPVFFRTTLPDCTEKRHGMEAVLDEGLNSQEIQCLRYQGSMKWVSTGKREPIQFHRQDPPLTREEFINSRGGIQVLASPISPGAGFLSRIAPSVLDTFGKSITPFGVRSPLNALVAFTQGVDNSGLLSDIATLALSSGSGVSLSQVLALISSASSNGEISEELGVILNVAGGIGDSIASGIKSNSLSVALQTSGKNALLQSFGTLSPELYSMYASYASGGALGAIDSAVAIGLDKLPSELSAYISPIITSGVDILNSKSFSTNEIINAAIGAGSKSLPQVADGLVSIVGGRNSIPTELTSRALGAIESGALGDIAKVFGDFKELPGVPKIDSSGILPKLASSSLELIGLGEEFSELMSGGLGINTLSTAFDLNPVSSVLRGVPGVGQLLGSDADCPCDPKCRKTKHSEDSDGNVLLKECGNIIANSSSSYNPTGDPTSNNKNSVAEVLNLLPTALGEDLCIPNPYDLTQLLSGVKRLNEMADRLDGAKNADWPELWTELVYTFESIEKALKQADNNITGVESVERKLIDAQHRLISKLMDGNGSFFSKALLSIVDTSKAIQDLYSFVKRLDAKKKGGKAGVFPTQSLKTVFENITKIALLNSASKKEAKSILSGTILPADREWRKLEPGAKLLDLTNVVLGGVPKDIPLNFEKCSTKRTKEKVLKDSLESKINSPVKPEPSSLFEAKLTPEQKTRLTNSPAISEPLSISGRSLNQIKEKSTSSLLDQIKFEQTRSEKGDAEC